MKKTLTWALTAIAVLTVLTGCEKEDKDEFPSGDVNKGAFLVDGYYVVDLGFPIKNKLWATCNIGATSAEQYGNYYAWGDTLPRYYYDWTNYPHCEKSNITIKKYSRWDANTYNKTKDDIKTLEADDDIATKLMGEKWSIPTKEDFGNLIFRCDWKCGKFNGVWGYLFTSKENGNSIFLPLAGKKDINDFLFSESIGFYWSKDLQDKIVVTEEEVNDYACILQFNKPSNPVNTKYEMRYVGLPIRPVYNYKK